MKTNVINGLFMVGFIPVDTARIKIGDAETDANPIIFETGVDGLYAVLAQTNEEGIVQKLIIDIGEYAPFAFHEEVAIEAENILMKDS
ncbi:MAG: hypothetical protein ACQEV7_04600 [Bacillota bacterium]